MRELVVWTVISQAYSSVALEQVGLDKTCGQHGW
jgi:hypothetical protein